MFRTRFDQTLKKIQTSITTYISLEACQLYVLIFSSLKQFRRAASHFIKKRRIKQVREAECLLAKDKPPNTERPPPAHSAT
jgi:hypothetical protein